MSGNVLVWCAVRQRHDGWRGIRGLAVYGAVLLVLTLWGAVRLGRGVDAEHSARVNICMLQVNLDHLHRGKGSIDTAFAVADRQIAEAHKSAPSLMILPESSLLCYLARSADRTLRVLRWVDSTATPLILGALHWEHARKGSASRYLAYNTAFMIRPDSGDFAMYHKVKLVPFSEALPFEGVFPALSRVNLGEADFARGTKPVVFDVGSGIRAVPLICYEVIYPAFVRERLDTTANLIVNGTNDGWFGRSPGPFQHAAMSRLRCIENGVSMARCANTGISMFVDQYGRVLSRTGMFERTVLCDSVSLARVGTIYGRLGDWVVWLSALITGLAMAIRLAQWNQQRRKRP